MGEIGSLMKWHPVLYSLLVLFAGTSGTRALVYVSKKMPPLSSDAGFWATWAYQLMKGASGLDPNKALLDPNVLRAAGVEEDTLKKAR